MMTGEPLSPVFVLRFILMGMLLVRRGSTSPFSLDSGPCKWDKRHAAKAAGLQLTPFLNEFSQFLIYPGRTDWDDKPAPFCQLVS